MPILVLVAPPNIRIVPRQYLRILHVKARERKLSPAEVLLSGVLSGVADAVGLLLTGVEAQVSVCAEGRPDM